MKPRYAFAPLWLLLVLGCLCLAIPFASAGKKDELRARSGGLLDIMSFQARALGNLAHELKYIDTPEKFSRKLKDFPPWRIERMAVVTEDRVYFITPKMAVEYNRGEDIIYMQLQGRNAEVTVPSEEKPATFLLALPEGDLPQARIQLVKLRAAKEDRFAVMSGLDMLGFKSQRVFQAMPTERDLPDAPEGFTLWEMSQGEILPIGEYALAVRVKRGDTKKEQRKTLYLYRRFPDVRHMYEIFFYDFSVQ